MMCCHLEQAVQYAIVAIPELEITPDKVMVSIPTEQERGGDWWRNPTVEIVFADTELRTPVIKRAALDAACRAVWKNFPEGYLQSVRGHYSTMDRTTQYVKVTADDFGPYAKIKKMISELVQACNSWALLADDPDEKPMLADNPIEWETSDDGTIRIEHHVTGQQHTNVTVSPNGNISISLSDTRNLHELSLIAGKEPSYNGGPGLCDDDFPKGMFASWLRAATDVCRM